MLLPAPEITILMTKSSKFKKIKIKTTGNIGLKNTKNLNKFYAKEIPSNPIPVRIRR
jgi:hypothetical protein